MSDYRGLSLVLSMMLGAAACSSPSEPSGSSGSITAPVASGPNDRTLFRNQDQPVTLAVQNVTATQSGNTTYTFEVATDSAFANKVQTRDNVPEGGNNLTSVKLDMLPADKDYYWHARAQRAGVVGAFGSTLSFNIGPGVVISAPVAVTPLSGAQVTVSRPIFTVLNAVKQGPAGTLVYTFEIATNPNFSPVAISATVPEGFNQTSFTPTTDLPENVTHYWRVTAVDQTSSVSSAPSAVQTFAAAPRTRQSDLAAQLGVTLWPSAQPPGATGRSILGDNWQVQTLYHAPSGTTFVSPSLEALRLFDLMDRGMSPQGAIDWLHDNRYPTVAQYYPSVAVIGIPYVYLAFINGRWDMVLRYE